MSRILLSAYACEPGKGSEPQVGWMWATELADLGHEVWVLTRATNREAIEPERGRRPRPQLHFAYCDLPRWARTWKRGRRGVHLYYALWQWVAYRRARQLVRRMRFDCVQHVTLVSLRAPSWMGRLGIPFYFGPVSGGECVPRQLRAGMSRGARWREWVRDLANRTVRGDPAMRCCFRRAEKILLATPESLALVPPKYRDKCAAQLAVGLSREYLMWSKLPHRKPGVALKLFYAGRLLEWKGLDLALEALAILKLQGVIAELTIAGDGPARDQLQRLARESGVGRQVRWLGWVAHDRLHSSYYASDVLLFPSLRDSGGMAVLEAMAHGLPVLCTDRGGPGVLVNRSCGRVIATAGRSRDDVVTALAEAIQELWQDRLLREQLSIAARRRAWDFDFRTIAAQMHGPAGAEIDNARAAQGVS